MKYNQSTALILKALIEQDKNITALQSGNFLTTRLSNHIVLLRDSGILIETVREVNDITKRWYGRYKLVYTEENLKKANELLAEIKADYQAHEVRD